MVELSTTVEERLAVGSALECAGRQLVVESSQPVAGEARAEGCPLARPLCRRGQPRSGREVWLVPTLRAEPLAAAEGLWVHELIGSEVVDRFRAGARRGGFRRSQPGQRPARAGHRGACAAALRCGSRARQANRRGPGGPVRHMRAEIFTIFPDLVSTWVGASLIGKAGKAGFIDIVVHDLRAGASDPHRSVDDSPFGGVPGWCWRPSPYSPPSKRPTR